MSHPRRQLVRSWLLVAALLLAPAAFAKKNKKSKGAPTPDDESGRHLTEVVKGADKLEGLMTFYRAGDELWLELSPEMLGEQLGFAAMMVHAAGDFRMRGGSIDNQVVRWQRIDGHLSLVKQNLDFRAEGDETMTAILDASFPDSPVFSASLIELADEPAPLLIDASKLFGPDLAELMPANSGYTIRAESGAPLWVRVFEDNVVARFVYSAERKPSGPTGSSGGGSSPFARFLQPGRLPDPRTAEIIVDYNFYRLPDDGYRPRFADERIGGFTIAYKDYSDVDADDTLFRHLLRRWDVRKADPEAAVADPIEPITFYLDHSVPEKWRDLVRDGALWWNTAFEKIGIRNAVRVLDPPDDPDWHPAALGHSVIYWNFSDNLVFSGVAGPILADPRTGKVLKANVHLNGEFFSYALNRYLVYAWWRAPDPGNGGAALRARREVTEALRGEPGGCDRSASFSSQIAFARLALQSRGVLEPGTDEADRFAREAFLELVAHEVGHALGFPHNWKSSLISSWDDVRSGNVDGLNGPRAMASSIMDYNPIYIAPPGAEQGDYVLQELGAYDDLAVEYIYSPLDGLSADETTAALDAIAARAETEPGLIYDSGMLGDIDPTVNSDDYGNDPLAFAESRLVLLQDEVLPRLPELVLGEGHDYNLLRQALDSAIFSVALDYIDMTARHVGGQILLKRVAGSPAAEAGGPPPITPVAAADQRRALEILGRRLFADDVFEFSPETLALLKADLQFDWNYAWRYASDYNVGNRIAGLYDAALATLLDPARLARVLDNERRVPEGEPRFSMPELFGWFEQTAFDGSAAPSTDRRALQRLLVSRLTSLTLTPPDGTPVEAAQLAAASLRSIQASVEAILESDAGLDAYARAHFEAVAAGAEQTLDAETFVPAAR